MKKSIFSLILILTCISVYANNQDDKFINALKNCSTYSSSGNINTQGIDVKSKMQILGWNNDKCTYKESLNLSGTNVDIICNFSKAQIKEITSVADAYFLTLKYSSANIDTSSLDSVKDNPLANVFNKYIQDPTVCSIQGL